MRLRPGNPGNELAIELWMQRYRAKQDVRRLRDQLARAQRRHSKATPVPLDTLDRLLTRVEMADA